MTLSIPTDSDSHGSDHSLSEEPAGEHVTIPSRGTNYYQDSDYYDEWERLPYPDEVKPSDSASRPRISNSTFHAPVWAVHQDTRDIRPLEIEVNELPILPVPLTNGMNTLLAFNDHELTGGNGHSQKQHLPISYYVPATTPKTSRFTLTWMQP
ncbi:hypothetical protein N7445_007865 [Penicillium cf. griseofulvum]|nr:hypothetical protein N7445_007865 [Penicillium cf. griseofulvum]